MEPKPEPTDAPITDVAPADTVQVEPPETPAADAPVTDASAVDAASADPEVQSAATEEAGDKKTDLTKLNLEKNAKAPAPPKKHGSGVTAAIIATVIIVLGLAAMAVYAYLQTV